MANTNKQRLVFLLGSGVSYKAGMPKLNEITEIALSGEGIYYDSGLKIFTSHKRPIAVARIQREQEENVQRVIEYLHRLKGEIDRYYELHKLKQDTNYEDLYYIAGQIYYSQVGEYDNPAIQPFVDKLLPELKSLLARTNTRSEWTIFELSRATMTYNRICGVSFSTQITNASRVFGLHKESL